MSYMLVPPVLIVNESEIAAGIQLPAPSFQSFDASSRDLSDAPA